MIRRLYSFETARGNKATVYAERTIVTMPSGMTCLGAQTRTFVRVADRTIDLEPGCAYKAWSATQAYAL